MNRHTTLSATPNVADLLTTGTNLSFTQPQLVSLLMNSYMKQTSPSTIPSPQDQQRTYVNALVDVTVQAIASIWPNSNTTPSQRPIANLNTFLHHILKHSRTTHSTLQLAIFYLFRIRPKVQERHGNDVYIACGRRMFLAALICAHKFLQDKTYKNSAWSKVSGLDVSEINHAEKVMLQLLDYQLFVKKETYDQWVSMLQTHLHIPTSPSSHSSLHHTSTRLLSSTTLSSPISSPLSSSSSIVHSTTSPISSSSIHPLNKISSNSTAFMMGMPTPIEDQVTSPIDMLGQRKRKSSMASLDGKKRRC